ncbi:MAG TPA: bifunctional folylpolyglutamate synthase/dihydrofolate synthase [Euryarchaeota archaeon]|nr:bifunctional folylpolyglutamate synthase/dihydrofolate synthase [Euryarchaeota archaeon]
MDPEGNIAWLDGLTRRGVKPGLENTEELLRRVGDPREGMRYIHVAGTDGKGSVCAMTESILKASGLRVGAFTSPHIMRVNECIRVDGEEIPDRDLVHLIGMVRPHAEAMAAEGMECTNFEVLTVMALKYFSLVSADIAVIEVGMGGRLDSTNVVTPVVTVINNIGMEHTEFLGDTIEKISLEKAGIMKPGVPCVTMNPDTVFDVLEEHAREVGCPLIRVMDTDAQVMASWPDCLDFVYRGESYTVALPGRHQARNASLAIEAVSSLPEYEDTIREHVPEGLETVSWPCRMQKMLAEPVIVDVTHTRNGAVCLHSDISEIYGEVVLVLAMLSDKDIDGVASELAPVSAKVFVASPDSPRAAEAERVADIMSGYHRVDGVFRTVGEAMEAAMECRDDLNILVTGSFRTAEDALRWLQSRYARS